MKQYNFKLDEGSKKFRCPSCNKKRFVKYIDSQTDEYLPEQYGRCDREVNCGYHRTPYQDDYAKNNDSDWRKPAMPKPEKPPKFIPTELFEKTLSGYNNNSFVKYLQSLFDNETVSEIINKYYVGSTKNGGCIFYQIDIENKIRRGKVMHYDNSGHRDKKRFNSVHAMYGWNDNLPDWRFFGEHLLVGSNKPVGIVESEKTAIVASVHFPKLTWLATGTLSTLKPQYGQSLKDRTVILFPDLGAFDDWAEKAEPLREFCNISVSDLLKRKATPEAHNEGYDLADYLTDLNYKGNSNTNTPIKKDNASNGKYEATPKNVDPQTGEVMYPAALDEVKPPKPGTDEYKRITQIAIQDATKTERQQLTQYHATNT